MAAGMVIAQIIGAVANIGAGAFAAKSIQDATETELELTHLDVLESMRQVRVEASALLGSQKALFSASGVDITVGSPMLVQAETISEAFRQEKFLADTGTAKIDAMRDAARSQQIQAVVGGFSGAVGNVGNIAGSK